MQTLKNTGMNTKYLPLLLMAALVLTACIGNGRATKEQGQDETDYSVCLDTLPEDSLDDKYATELLKAGTGVPDFALPTPDGDTLHLSDFHGQWVVMDFWASWCPDCRRDLPEVLRLYETYAPSGVAFVGISFDDDTTAWKNALKDFALPYPQVCEMRRMRDSETAKCFGIRWII